MPSGSYINPEESDKVTTLPPKLLTMFMQNLRTSIFPVHSMIIGKSDLQYLLSFIIKFFSLNLDLINLRASLVHFDMFPSINLPYHQQ